MGVMDLLRENQTDKGFGGIEAPSTTVGDVFSADVDNTVRNFNPMSEPIFQMIETSARNKKYLETTGRAIYDDAFEDQPDRDKLHEAIRMGRDNDPRVIQAIDQYISAKKADNPKYADIKTSGEVTDAVKQKALAAQEASAKAHAGATNTGGFIGGLAGGLVAGLADPVNLATLPLGAGMASGIIKTALTDAALNMGAEAVSYPFIQHWQEKLGEEYGPKDLAKNLGIAAIFGGALGGGSKALHVGLEHMGLSRSAMLSEIRERVPDNPELQEALRHEERRLSIEESDPSKVSDMPYEVHQKALEETDAAINEERPLNSANLPTDEQIRAMDESKMSEMDAEAHARIVDDTPAPEVKDREVNPLVDLNEKEPLTFEQTDKLQEIQDSPEFKAQEKRTFDETFPEPLEEGAELPEGAPPQEPVPEKIWGREGGEDMSPEELKELFKEDQEFISAISSCSIGVKE